MALKAWYDIDDEPIDVSTADDLDALLERMTSDGMEWVVPPLVELSSRSTDGWAIAYVGINAKSGLGIMTHLGPTDSVISFNGTSTLEPVNYDYMGHLRELPASAEIPLADIRRAVDEFFATNGTRPTSVAWQVVE